MARYYNLEGEPIECDVRKARKEKLYPSVTTILKTLNKEFLNEWKTRNAVMSALTLPKLEGESLDDFAKRVMEDADKQSKDAMTLGSEIHNLVEHEGNTEASDKAKEFYNAVKDELNKKFPVVLEKEAVLVSPLGYAGRFDALCKDASGQLYLVDYKTQSTKAGRKSNAYDEYFMQLEAYKEVLKGLGHKDIKSCIVVISTTELGRIDFHEIEPEEEVKFKKMFSHILSFFLLSKKLNFKEE